MSKNLKRMGYADTGDGGMPGTGYGKRIAIVTAVTAERFQLDVRLVSGSNQNYLEEHERIERVYRANTLDDLLRIGIAEVRGDAELADNAPALTEAIRRAVFEAEDLGLGGLAARIYDASEDGMNAIMRELKCSRQRADEIIAEGTQS